MSLESLTTVKVLGVIGPLLAAIGAALLAYDAFRGPTRWYQLIFPLRDTLRGAERLHAHNLNVLRDLPIPPYTQAEKKKRIDEEIKSYTEHVNVEEDKFDRRDLEERLRSQRLAKRGFLLVAVGSLLQALAALLS